MSAPVGRKLLPTKRSEFEWITRESASLHPTCLHLAPLPTAARDQPRYVPSGRPLVNWVEAYSAS